MKTQLNSSPITKTLITCASLVIIVAGMKLASAILVPFLLAVFIAIIVTPIYFSLQRIGLNPAVTLLVMITTMVLIGSLGILIIKASIDDFQESRGNYPEQYSVQMEELQTWLRHWNLMEENQSFGDLISGRDVMSYLNVLANTIRGLLSQGTLILIVVIFILLEVATMPDKIRALPGLTDDTWQRMTQIVGDTRRYIMLKTVTSALTGVLVWLMLRVLRVESAEFLGLLAFVLNFVPTIGSIIAGIPGVLLAFVGHGPITAIIATVGYLVVNFGVSNGLDPKIMGRGLGLSPLVIIISMFFWGWVLGPIGMLLSVPLAMTAKIALEADEETRWIAMLMASGARLRAAQRREQGKDKRKLKNARR
jgi:predicted PurR-regulated permease PerM